MLKLFKFTLAVIILVILGHYYNEHKKVVNSRKLDKLDLIQEYLLNGRGGISSKKPILWIHNKYKINARDWASFGSRNTEDLNQPYLYLCVNSMIKHCANSFNVVLINDSSFKKLIPGWNVSMDILSSPIQDHMRCFALAQLLYYYGGMLVPCSTLALGDFKPLFNKGVSQHGCFTIEKVNRTSTSQHKQFFPTIKMLGCERKNSTMLELVKYLEVLALSDYTSEVDFLGEADRWLYDKTSKHKITLIDGKAMGIKTICGKPVYINDLLSDKYINFDKRVLTGIYIPCDELLKRTNYQWFTRLSQEQVLAADTLISRYILLSLGKN